MALYRTAFRNKLSCAYLLLLSTSTRRKFLSNYYLNAIDQRNIRLAKIYAVSIQVCGIEHASNSIPIVCLRHINTHTHPYLIAFM